MFGRAIKRYTRHKKQMIYRRHKKQMINGNIETDARELLRGNKIGVPT